MFYLRVFSISIRKSASPFINYLFQQFFQIWKWYKAGDVNDTFILNMSETLGNIYILVFW